MAAVFGVQTRKLFLGAITAGVLAIALYPISLSYVRKDVERVWAWADSPFASAACSCHTHLLYVVFSRDRL